jgi:hypothetical protein
MRSPPREIEANKENRSTKKKGDKKDKSKSQASFALMHGFTATNVGKSRITVRGPYHIMLADLLKNPTVRTSPPECWCFPKRQGIPCSGNGEFNRKETKHVFFFDESWA